MLKSTLKIARRLQAFNSNGSPTWDYDILSIQLYVKELQKFGHVQCYVGFKYILYELDGSTLSYRVREFSNKKYSEVIHSVDVGKHMRELRLIALLLAHKRVIESAYGF